MRPKRIFARLVILIADAVQHFVAGRKVGTGASTSVENHEFQARACELSVRLRPRNKYESKGLASYKTFDCTHNRQLDEVKGWHPSLADGADAKASGPSRVGFSVRRTLNAVGNLYLSEFRCGRSRR